MFDGYGLFGTGIGTGIIGKIEDIVLSVGCAVGGVKRAWENSKYPDEIILDDEEGTEDESVKEETTEETLEELEGQAQEKTQEMETEEIS